MAQVHHRSVGAHTVITIVSGPPWNQNCHLVAAPATGTFLIVDPGADSPELDEAIRVLGMRPTLMLVTHGHPDHLGAASRLSADLDLDCLVGRGDERVVRHAPAYAAAFGKVQLELPERIRYIDADADLRLGDETVAILPLPGHTPGSLAFNVGSLVLTGDTLFREKVGRTDLPAGDASALVSSVDLLVASFPDATQFFPGHGQPWSAGEARSWWSASRRAATVAVAL